jgi:nitrogenase subunit NifH
MNLKDDLIKTDTIVSESQSQDVEYSSEKHEKIVHKKEQHQQLNYFKKLSESIRNYQDVLLFGPTDAKKELLNLLRSDHLFDKTKIDIKNSDKMSEVQMQIFVREYFK